MSPSAWRTTIATSAGDHRDHVPEERLGPLRKPMVRCVPSQNGLFPEPPHLHSATRVSSRIRCPLASSIRILPRTNKGPFGRSWTVGSWGSGSWSPPSRRRKWRAPVGQRMTTSAISSADAASTAIHGRRHGSNTAGSPSKQSAAWMQYAGSQVTTICSFAYSFLISVSYRVSSWYPTGSFMRSGPAVSPVGKRFTQNPWRRQALGLHARRRHHIAAVDGLALEQQRRDLIQCYPVIREQGHRSLVGFLEEALDLLIDHPLRRLRVLAAPDLLLTEIGGTVARESDRSELGAHPELHDHPGGELSGPGEVVRPRAAAGSPRAPARREGWSPSTPDPRVPRGQQPAHGRPRAPRRLASPPTAARSKH